MDEKMKNRIHEVLGEEMLEKVTGGVGGGINDSFPEVDPEQVKQMMLMIYENFGRELAIEYAVSLLNCTREEAASWLPKE